MEQKKPVILFLPEAGIHPFLHSISLVGDAFLQHDHPVYLIECNGILDRCPMQASFGNKRIFSNEEKKQLCDNCSKNTRRAAKYYGFNVLPLCDYINIKDKQLIESIFPQKIVEYEKIEFKGCKIGRLAIYDLMLETKVLDVSDTLSPDAVIIYRGYIVSMAKIIVIIENIIKYLSPYLFVSFNPYSQNQAVKFTAERFNSSFAMISDEQHCGAYSQLLYYDKKLFGYNWIMNLELWPGNKLLLVPASGISAAFEDIIYRMNEKGSHIFSSSRSGNLEEFIKKQNLYNKKIILAFTSSLDETISGDICRNEWGETADSKFAFNNQIEWIQFLKEFTMNRDDIFCIVRIHPREAIDGGSEHLRLLKETFPNENSHNFLIIWPEDPISSYDLMEIADICLISLSTTGLECMRLGVPVLAYYSKKGYVDDGYINVVTERKKYEERLNKMINTNYDYQYLLNAVRFYYWRVLMRSFFLGSNIPRNLTNNKFYKASKKINVILYNIFTNKTSIFEYNFNKLKQSQEFISKKSELRSLNTGISWLINTLCVNISDKKKNSLTSRIKRKVIRTLRIKDIKVKKSKSFLIIYYDGINKFDETLVKSKKNKHTIYILKDDIYSYKFYRGNYTKYISKAVSRLAKMYQEVIEMEKLC